MDFAYTADEQAFAAEVRRFLAEHPPDRFAVDGMDAGYGSGSHSRPFLRALADQGWLSMTWPKAYGGQERPMFFKLALLEELPSSRTGLGATEMRFLELIARGYFRTNGLFYLRGLRQRYVFSEWEMGFLLEGLAHGPKPAVAGLDDELRTLSRENYRDRETAYRRSELTLTEFGKSVLAHEDDFSRHNPIDRWWGGTRLTNDRMWHWAPVLIAPQ